MKVIRHQQYTRIRQELTAYADCRTDTYEYLYLIINGRARGQKKTDEGPKRLMSLEQIKKAWNDTEQRTALTRLAVLRHYKGCIVETKPQESFIVTDDILLTQSIELKQKIKDTDEKRKKQLQ